MDYLEAKGVGTRLIMAVDNDQQLALRLVSCRKVSELPNSRLIHRNAFFFGNYHGIGAEEREKPRALGD